MRTVPGLTSFSATVDHIVKSQGYIVAVSSIAAQVRVPCASEYNISKHALGRLVEYIGIGTLTHSVFNLCPVADITSQIIPVSAPSR